MLRATEHGFGTSYGFAETAATLGNGNTSNLVGPRKHQPGNTFKLNQFVLSSANTFVSAASGISK
jgi:hypothetical protein